MCAVVACQIFIPLDSPVESSTPPLEQRLWMMPGTPLMIVLGLAEACVWPRELWFAPGWYPLIVLLYYVLLAILILSCRRFYPFLALCGLQVASIAVSLVFFLRLGDFPGGP